MKKFVSMLTVLLLAFCLTVPAFAYDFNGVNLQDDVLMPDGSVVKLSTFYVNQGRPQILLYYNASVGSTSMYVVKGDVISDGGYLKLVDNTQYDTMVYNSNHQWVFTDTWTSDGAGWALLSTGDCKWVAQEVQRKDGTVWREGDPNFPVLSLAELVLEVSQGEMVEVMIPETVGVLKILVPCGVGLMALLAGLKLFGKRSLIFRS